MLHTECLWFCFHGLLQEDLDYSRVHWSTHKIRPSRYGTVPGVPDVLYFLPENFGAQESKVPLSRENIHEMEIHVEDDDDEDYREELRTIFILLWIVNTSFVQTPLVKHLNFFRNS